MKKLKMQLFGSFRLDNGEAILGEENFRFNKPTRLLVYLLMNREHMLTHRQLIETFWEDDSKSPEGALKTQIYRVRNELKVLGDENFICTLPGAYQWNPEVEVITDYEEFETLASELRETDDDRKKEDICRKIISCYRGNVSAKVADEFWLLPKVTWYESIYMNTVKQLCEILGKTKRWEEVELICNQAILIDALDEDVHCLLVAALRSQKKYDLALQQYEKACRLFYENMGIPCPQKLQLVFQEIMSEINKDITDIGRFLEDARERETPAQVFFCDYQIFRQIYRMEMRRADRLGIAEFIVLFTLRRNDIGKLNNIDRGLIKGMNILERSIGQSLRVGDVASKYSPTQVLVLLPTCTYEAGVKVAERICRNFQSRVRNRRLELKYELAELSGFR